MKVYTLCTFWTLVLIPACSGQSTTRRRTPTTTTSDGQPDDFSGDYSGDVVFGDVCDVRSHVDTDDDYLLNALTPDYAGCGCNITNNSGFSVEVCVPRCVATTPVKGGDCVFTDRPENIVVRLSECRNWDWASDEIYVSIYKDGGPINPTRDFVFINCMRNFPAPPSPNNPENTIDTTTIALGAGLGGGVVVVLVLGIVIGFYCNKRRRKSDATRAKEGTSSSSPASNTTASTYTGTPNNGYGDRALHKHEAVPTINNERNQHVYTTLNTDSTYEVIVDNEMAPDPPPLRPSAESGPHDGYETPINNADMNSSFSADVIVDNDDYESSRGYGGNVQYDATNTSHPGAGLQGQVSIGGDPEYLELK